MDNELKNTDMFDAVVVVAVVLCVCVFFPLLLFFVNGFVLSFFHIFILFTFLLVRIVWICAFGMRISWSISLWRYVCSYWMKNLWDYRVDLCVCSFFCVYRHSVTLSLLLAIVSLSPSQSVIKECPRKCAWIKCTYIYVSSNPKKTNYFSIYFTLFSLFFSLLFCCCQNASKTKTGALNGTKSTMPMQRDQRATHTHQTDEM